MHATTFKTNGCRLPDFIIPGAAKSGTTTLFQILNQHPSIFFPANRKEPFYFSFGNEKPTYTDQSFVDNLVWKTRDYVDLYANCPEDSLAGDASTSYLYTAHNTIQHMQELYGNNLSEVKVIILLRNPIDRAYSHYTYLIRNGLETRSFEEAISPEGISTWKKFRWGFDYLGYGLYADQIQVFQENFPKCKILLSEDLKNIDHTINQVLSFLELPFVQLNTGINANPSGIPKSRIIVNAMRTNPILKAAVGLLPDRLKQKAISSRDTLMAKMLRKEPMLESTRRKLLQFYRPDVELLEKRINRDLSHWINS